MKTIVALLITVSVCLAVVAVYSFGMSAYLRRLHADLQTGEKRQEHRTFVEDVLDGRGQGRPEQYVDALRVQWETIQAERSVSGSVIVTLRDLGWLAISAILTQLAAIYYLRRRLKNQ